MIEKDLTNLKLVFSTIFGQGSKSDAIAAQLFQKVIEFLEKDDSFFSKKDEKQKILSRLSNQATLKIIWKCEYACSIVIRKTSKESPIDIYIVVPEEWGSGISHWKDKNFEHCEPQGESTFYLPRVAENQIPFEEFCEKFSHHLEMAINQKKTELSNIKQQLTPTLSIIQEACKRATFLCKFTTSYNDIWQQEEQKEEENKKKTFTTQTPNVDLHNSEANTCWYVPMATITDLIKRHSPPKDWPGAERLIIGFMGHLLEKVTSQRAKEAKYIQEEVTNFKRCLDELIFRYKKKISVQENKNINRIKDFLKFIGKINQNLKKITNNGLTSKILDIQVSKGNLKFEDPKISSILKPSKQAHAPGEIVLAKIDEYPLKTERRLLFEELLEIGSGIQQKDFIQKDKWVLLTERTLFSLTEEFNSDHQIIDLHIHMRQIQCQIGASDLCLLVEKYEKLLKKDNSHEIHFGSNMRGQTRSHIELVKTIASIVAFESVKMNRQKKKSNLQNYRIPINIEALFKGFVSQSYEARRAMKNVFQYHEIRKNKKQIFLLDGSSKSFAEFARLTAQQTRSAHVWVNKIKQEILLKKELALKEIQLRQVNNRMKKALDNQTALSISKLSRSEIQKLTVNEYISSVFSQFNQSDPWLFAFLENITSDILGMMKMFYYAQNPSFQNYKKDPNNIFNEHFPSEKFSIKIYADQPQKDSIFFSSGTVTIENIPVSKNFQDAKIFFNDSSNGVPLTPNLFENYRKLFDSQQKNSEFEGKLEYISHRPDDEKILNREHRVYAKQNHRPEEVEIEDFLAIGNIRSAENTQLMVLCFNILERKIVSNSYLKGCLLGEETILQTTGQLSIYQPKVEKQFKQIRKLITEFIKVWAFTDVNFCPVIGPFFGYISRALIDDQIPDEEESEIVKRIVFQICKKCLDEYERGETQLKSKPNEKIQWYQRFTLTAALTCLREIILTKEDEDQTVMLCNVIFALRSTQILSGREEKPADMREFHDQLAFGISKTTLYNIETISNLLNEKPHYIGQILKKMDPSYQEDVVWKRENLFSFNGKSEKNDDIYQIDLYLGKIFKNGKEISALDPVIKQNPSFVDIFGKDRQFQVFQSHHAHFLRTKNSVNYQFRIPETKGLIFFEFSKDGTEIRHIFRKHGGTTKDEEIWVLIPKQKLLKSDCCFPKLFLDHYRAWYSEKRKCVMFRKTQFEKIYHAGIVVHLKNYEITMEIDKAYYITYHGSFDNQDLDTLCDKETKKFSEIILRSKEQKLENVKCFEILSKFENPEYILELRNGEKIEYLLHRYQSKFWLEEETRLSSESYFGYSLDYSFYENQNCMFNRFPCLVLQKHSKNQALLNNHKRIVVISEGQIQFGGKIKKDPVADQHIGSLKYEIHDFFGDLRGATRESLLHLSALMLSINDNMKVTSIQMTPLDYSIHLLKSCLSNRPYCQKDNDKISEIVRNLNPPESYVLLLECLWQCSKALIGILPFREEKFHSVFHKLHDKQLMTCRDLYVKNIGNQIVRYREKISFDLLNYLGMSLSEESMYGDTESSSSANSDSDPSSSSDQSSRAQKTKKYWKNLKEFDGKKFEANFEKIKSDFKDFNVIAHELCMIWKEEDPKKSVGQNKISKNIKKLVENPECNPMTKEMIEELQNSYDIFLKEEDRINLIIKKLNTNKNSQISTIKELIRRGSEIVREIQELIQKIKEKNEEHPDAITGTKPTLSFICFTNILCDPKNIINFFPFLKSSAQAGLTDTIKIWVELKTRLASFERIKVLFESTTLDVIALMREAESPRDQVRKKHHWLCFEAENKVQLWSSQLDTYKNLTESGDFCQLNMGEGKTQVIIPMMILDAIYEKKNFLPRINLLNSLIDEARGNFFRFLSVTSFQIPGFEIPFTREVDLYHDLKKKDQNILTVQNLINSFSNRLYILMTRESRLSEILRFAEINKDYKQVSMKQCPLIPLNLKIFDIFDEIDELMNPIKSYIFSIGTTVDLPSSKERFEILRILIEVFLDKHLQQMMKKNMAISEQTFDQTLEFVKKGNYPPGLRLNIEHSKPEEIMKFKRILAKDVALKLKNGYFSFFKKLSKNQKKTVIDFITNPLDITLQFPDFVEKTWRTQILVLRGALGYGIFQHCLSMRCGVNYGIPNKEHKKRIAVPYDAADIPSKTSEYQHPDVSILLSYFAYYTKGLTYEQFLEAVKKLLTLSSTSKMIEYNSWFKTLSPEAQEEINIKNAQQINFNSKVVVNEMYKFYRRNRKAIAFWLNVCIFPSNLRQYNQSISASAWNLADVENSVGFSGTKDNHWLYSDKLNWKPCKTPSISGTDGKMIHLITKNTNKICLIQENDNNQWQRFVNEALQQNVDCIIDAGALCVGKSLEREIVPWIAEHELFKSEKFAGISFCDENGKWKVYDIESKYYIARGTSIPDHETFVIFDEARTRGADLKMDADVVAAISLGPQMTKDKFMQAAGRLRKLGRNQKLIIMATQQIFSSLPQFAKVKDIEKKIQNTGTEELANEILGWCCQNSIQLNERLLMQYANLGWDYIRSKVDNEIFIKGIRNEDNDKENPRNLSDLDRMYEHGLEKTTVAKLNQKIVNNLAEKYIQSSSGIQINNVLSTYGKNVSRQAGSLDDVCERQVEPEPQVQKEQEDAVKELEPIPQVDNPDQETSIKGISVVFDGNFKLSENFIETTREANSFSFPSSSKINQLSELYFVLYDSVSIKAITLREASKYIKKHIIEESSESHRIQFLNNLSTENEFIRANKLESALVSAKFVSGVENYSEEEQDQLLKMFLRTIRENTKWRENYEKLTSVILSKKRVYYKKFFGSTLEKIVTRLKNEDIEGKNPDELNQPLNEHEAEDESDFWSDDEKIDDEKNKMEMKLIAAT